MIIFLDPDYEDAFCTLLHGDSDASFRDWVSLEFFPSVYKKVVELLFNLVIYEVCFVSNNQPNLLLGLQFLPPKRKKKRFSEDFDGPIVFKRPYAIVKRFGPAEYLKFWNLYQRERVVLFKDPPCFKNLILTAVLYGLWSRKLKLTAEYYYNAALHWEFFLDAVKKYAFVKRCSNHSRRRRTMITEESHKIAQVAAESSFTFVEEPTQGNKLLMVNTSEARDNQELLTPFLKLKSALENIGVDGDNDDEVIKSDLIFDYLSELKMQYTKRGFLKCLIPARKELIHSIRLEARGEHEKLINDWESLICFQRCSRRDCLAQQIWNLPEPSFAILPAWVFMNCENRDEYWELMSSSVEAEKKRIKIEEKKSAKKGKQRQKEGFIVEQTPPSLQNCLVCFIYRLLEIPEWKIYLRVFFGSWWSETEDPDLSELLRGIHLEHRCETDGIVGCRSVYTIFHAKWPEIESVVDYHGSSEPAVV